MNREELLKNAKPILFNTEMVQAITEGRINTGNYTTQTGEKRYTTDVIADRVEFIGKSGQAKPQSEDIFEPTDYNPFEEDSNNIPF